MRQILCVHLKQWAIDRYLRKRRLGRDRALGSASAHHPLVLVKQVATRQVIMAASRAAQAHGICCEMTLAEACALCPNLEHGEYRPSEDRKGLLGLGRWMMRFSPVVALDPSDNGESDGPAVIYVDVSGCERLYGSLAVLMEQVDGGLKRLRLHATLAIAPTPGAAFALAVSGRHQTIVNLAEALAPLSPDVLRIDPATSQMLHHLGIRTIGQLMKLPRQSLPARFGEQLLMRLDQALGRIDEPLTPLKYQSPIEAKIDFEGPIDALETIWNAFGQMVKEVIGQLTERGCGARRMEIAFLRPYAPVISKTILLARPSRDGRNLFNLIRCAMEGLEEEAGNKGKQWKKRSRLAHLAASEDFSSDGFIGLRLVVPVFERLTHEQGALLEHENRAAEAELDQLIERLCLRMGEEAVVRPYLVESHIPEKAFAGMPATSSSQLQIANCKLQIDRPMRLYETPIEIRAMVSPSHDRNGRPISFTLEREVHRLAHAIGPERIAGQWWEGHDKTRDYFIVEDEEGRRFWIFRVMESSRWYLHGEFE